jgi:hypothetical protein
MLYRRLWLTIVAYAMKGITGSFAFVPIYADMLITAK